MKFVGLDGLKHFWTKIEAKVIKIIEDQIAQIIAEAPESLNTLKEIADWISSHADDAAAMNTEILANTEAISGKADKIHTHTKSQITDFPTSLKNPNALTINGKTYDGSTAVDAGVQTVANGGTGVSTQAEINKAFISNLDVGTSDVTDGTEFVSSYASDSGFSSTDEGSLHKPYKRQFVKVWNYIKNKISSVLGLTKDNYGGKASTAGTADRAATANNGFNSSTVTDSTPGWGYLTSGNGYSNGRTYGFANGGGIATAEKDTQSSLQVDGDLYVHEGLDKVATLNDIPTSLPANGGTATKATQDGNGNVITSTYVKKSGDTLTGPIVMKANQYTLDTAQLDMKNSDIKGANAIWFDDHAEVGEGLKFPRSSGSNYDFMRLDDGKIKVAPNVTENANTATESIVAYTSDIPTSLPANGGTATTATNLKVSNHDTNNTTYYPIWANGKGDGGTARGTYTSTDLNYIPATGNFKSKQFTVGGGVSLQWNSTTKSLDFTFA